MADLSSYINISANTISATGNIVANTVIANTDLSGDGGKLSNISGANVVGNIPNANIVTANFYYGDGSNISNISISSGTNPIATSGNVTAGNVTSNGSVTANTFVGNISGSNVTGTVANANYSVYSGTASVANSVAAANISGTINLANYATTANSVAGANVSGEVAYATTANAVAGANVTGTVNLANYATTANSVALANVSGIGNIANINLNGNGAQVLAGNGSWVVAGGTYSNSNVANYLPTYTGNLGNVNNITANTLVVTGNANVQGTLTYNNLSSLTTSNLVLGLGNNQTGINVTGGGIVVGNTAEASFLYNYSTQVWQSNIGLGAIGDITTSANVNATNANLGNVATANYFLGAGNNLSNIQGSNINGAVGLATYAGTANSVAGANVSGAVGLATYAGTANSVAGANVSGQVNYAATANSVAGANVSGTVANATYAVTAGTANSVAAANVTGTVNLANYATTANSVAGANVTGTVANATYATTAGTVTTAAQPNITSTGTLSSLAVTGNVNSGGLSVNGSGVVTGNLQIQGTLTYNNLTNLTTSNLVLGLGNNQTGVSVNGAGIVAGNTAEASFLYNYSAQTWNSNIGLSAVGNITGANINTAGKVVASTITSNVATGTAPLVVTSTTQVANLNVATSGLATYATTANSVAGANVSGAVAYATTANAVAGANVSGQVSNALVAGTVYTNAQPNITSTGTLTSLAVTGNITNGNVTGGNLVSANYFTGTLTTAAQPNITSTGTLTSLTVTGNVTGGNIVSGGVANITGNITGANLIAGASGTGNVYAGNVIVNGQPTTYGVASPEYISMTTSASVNVATSGTDLTWDVNNGSSGITYSSGKFSLKAGKTYQIMGEPAFQNYSGNGYLLVELVDGTTNARLGSQTLSLPYNTGYNEVNNFVYDLVYTPVANQDVKFRVTGGTSGLTAQLRGSGFARMSIVQINPTIAVQATVTGTVNNQYSGVTLTSNQVIGSPGTPTNIVFQSATGTVPYNTSTGVWTLTSGVTYNLTAVLAVTGASNYLGYQWVDSVSGTALSTALGFATLATTQVSSVPLSIVYTPNTNQTIALRNVNGQYASVIANYSWAIVTQINQAFALNALATMATTGDVSVGGNLTATGGIRKSARVLTTTTTLTLADASGFIEFAGSGTYTVTLPDPTQAANSGIGYRFWQNTSQNITLSTPAGNFYGPSGSSASTKVLTQATTQYWDVWSDGYNWVVFGIKTV